MVEHLRAQLLEERSKTAAQPNVHPGTFVKVCMRGERFWCRVKHVRPDTSLLAVVDNDLVKSQWKCGDEITLQYTHVLETTEPADELTFRSLEARLGSAADAAIAWRNLRRASGVAVAPARLGMTMYLLPPSVNVCGTHAWAQP